ncbi:Short-chain dehydrogenase/reductase tropE [Paramyrothecium foliicola]|nr:Short-chain dehydrogenase/reductase tropE [Paramyrothecium foliicola]
MSLRRDGASRAEVEEFNSASGHEKHWRYNAPPGLIKRIVLITGANTGLGYEIVKALSGSDKPYEILLGGRSIEKAQAAAESARAEFPNSQSNIRPVQIDIQDDKSIDALFNEVKGTYGKLDVLINNAGTQVDQQYMAGKMTMREVWSQSWDVNVVSTNFITHQFVPLLLSSDDPRIAFMASGTSSLTTSEGLSLAINKSPPKGWPKDAFSLPAYRSSKTGMNMMMRTLKEDGVKIWCISPGFLATSLGGSAEAMKKMGGADPSIGATFIKDVVEGARDIDVGKVINKDGIQPW